MNKLLMASLSGLFFVCSFFASAEGENAELKAVNIEVEQRAVQLDQDFGIILTSQERSTLKLSIIANKVAANQSDASVREKTDNAIVIYEITDPVDQRQLLITIELSTGGGGGRRPPCCENQSE